MLLQLRDGKYYVQFYHFKRGELGTMHGMLKGRGTSAFLRKDVGDDVEDISSVHSFCHPNDNFERKVGRKLAFAKLVKSMINLNVISTKEERQLCWNTYFENFKKGK
jgi:hypothetical protein